jgi:hypothetical protein
MVQASCYQLVLDRKLGEYTLPDGWAIVAAENRDSDRAATTRMPTPLRNRFVHLEFEVDLQEWCEWAIQAAIRPEVIAFLRFRPAFVVMQQYGITEARTGDRHFEQAGFRALLR